MGRSHPVSTADIAYLRRAVSENIHFKDMAAHLGVCVDTLKRILMREGICEFDGAKFIPSIRRRAATATWSRPCINCRSTTPRPHGQYICASCKALQDDSCGARWAAF